MPAITRKRSRSTVYDSGDSGAEEGSRYGSPGPEPKKSKPSSKSRASRGAGENNEKSPEQRAQELKERYGKRRAEIVAEHKRLTDELFKELIKATKEQNEIRAAQQENDFNEYSRLVQVRTEIEADIAARVDQFQEQAEQLAMRLEVALVGRVAEASQKLDISDICKTEKFSN